MKILITTGIYPPDIGGPARMIEQLAADLSKQGVEIAVLSFGKDVGQRTPFRVEKALSKLDFVFRLKRLAQNADLIYAFDLYTAGFLSWLIGKKILKKKLIVRFAGDSAWESAINSGKTTDDIVTFQKRYYGFKIALLKMARRWIMTEADKIVAVSNFMKELAIKIGVSQNKIKTIYNSVDFIDFNFQNTETINLKKSLGLNESKIIVTAGRLVPWKGIDGLIGAFFQLTKELPATRLLVVGEGADRDRLKKIVQEKNIEDKVIFVGRVSLDKIFTYYNLADVFVLNSQYEGLSHVLLEVLRLGKPIVASNCGGNPEVIENEKNGLLVEYNNTEQLQVAIKRILTEGKWHTGEYQNTCRESLKKFNWHNVIEQTIKVFKDV